MFVDRKVVGRIGDFDGHLQLSKGFHVLGLKSEFWGLHEYQVYVVEGVTRIDIPVIRQDAAEERLR